MPSLKQTGPLLIVGFIGALALSVLKNSLTYRDADLQAIAKKAAESSVRTILLPGIWKDAAKEDLTNFSADGTFHEEDNFSQTFPTDAPLSGTMSQKFRVQYSGHWDLLGDQLTVVIKSVDGVEFQDLHIFAPDYEKKYGKETLQQVQEKVLKEMRETMREKMAKELVGKSDVITIVTLNKKEFVGTNRGKMVTLLRIE